MNVLTEHPTKIVGMLTAGLGFVQAYPGLPDLLGERTYAWVMFVVGLLVVMLGFWNTHRANQAPPSPPPVGSHWLAGLFAFKIALLVSVISVLLAGCATTAPLKPTRTACAQGETFEIKRCVKTIAEEYEIYQKRALALVQEPGVTEEVKERVRKVEAELTPPMVEMLKASRAYDHIQLQLAAGESEQERLEIANRELLNWINMAEPILLRFIEAVGG
jgi:hypothetical protein